MQLKSVFPNVAISLRFSTSFIKRSRISIEIRAFEYPDTVLVSILDQIGIYEYKWLSSTKLLVISECCLKATLYDIFAKEAFMLPDLKLSKRAIFIKKQFIGVIQKNEDKDFFELFHFEPLYSMTRFAIDAKNASKVYLGFENLFLFFLDKSNSKIITVYSLFGIKYADLYLENTLICFKLNQIQEFAIIIDSENNIYRLNTKSLNLTLETSVDKILLNCEKSKIFEQIEDESKQDFNEKAFFGAKRYTFKSNNKFQPKKLGISSIKTPVCKIMVNSNSTKLIFRFSFVKRRISSIIFRG